MFYNRLLSGFILSLCISVHLSTAYASESLLLSKSYSDSDEPETINDNRLNSNDSLVSAPLSIFDGPYVFYNDTAIKTILLMVNDTTQEITRREQTYNLSDTNRVLEGLGQNFSDYIINPYTEYTYDSIFEHKAEKICAISDIHGSYNHFVKLMISNGVINQSMDWIYNEGHLVILGDVFDKGSGVTESLWLIKKLESQAREAGGKVHFVLGNHDAFILLKFSGRTQRKYNVTAYNIGVWYFQLFGNDTELGKWLRKKPIAIKINDILFSHGGISNSIIRNQMDLVDINKRMWKILEHDNVIFFADKDQELSRLILGACGPVMFRGYVDSSYAHCNESVTIHSVKEVLDFYNCDKMVVGHEEVEHINATYNDMVYSINVPFPVDDVVTENSKGQVLIIKDSEFYSGDLKGNQTLIHQIIVEKELINKP